MSKLCAHFQGVPELSTEATEVVRGSKMPWVKGIDVQHWHTDARTMFPGKSVLARVYMLESNEASFIRGGVPGARLYVNSLRPIYDQLKAGGAVAVEGPNEHYPNYNELTAYVDFAREWIKLVAGLGLRPAWVTSTGQPGLLKYNDQNNRPTARDLSYLYADLYTYGGIWAAHEYGCPTLEGSAPWLMLRYRDTINELAGVSPLAREIDIIVSECGIDGGVTGDPAQVSHGWKYYTDAAMYQDQLAWYDGELAKDARVLAATPFTTCPTAKWASFDINGDMLAWMASRYDQEPEPPDPPAPPDLVTVPRDMLESWSSRLLAILKQASSIEDSADSLLVELEMILEGGSE